MSFLDLDGPSTINKGYPSAALDACATTGAGPKSFFEHFEAR
jgi:hypothetical protein